VPLALQQFTQGLLMARNGPDSPPDDVGSRGQSRPPGCAPGLLSLTHTGLFRRSAFVAVARVRRAGKTASVVDIEVVDEQERRVAIGRGAYSSNAG
jgi:hypothetical protein